MNKENIFSVLRRMNEKMQAERDFLTDLDNAIADGDHGINMAKGFAAVAEKLDTLGGQNLGGILRTVGMTLVSAVGGSAGPLYGTAFMRAGGVMQEREEMTVDDFIACMKAGIEGVMTRGHAVYGEKTMLDAMIPALSAMEEKNTQGVSAKEVLEAGVAAAREGVEYTKTIPATKGRASYIGERSIGHQDPGATSVTFLLEVIAGAV